MKPLRTILACLLTLAFCSTAAAEIRCQSLPSGVTAYARVELTFNSWFAVQLTERGTGGDGVYVATDAQILTAAGGTLAANTSPGYTYTVRLGTASTTATDSPVGGGVLPWTGTAELTQLQTGDSYALASGANGFAAMKTVVDAAKVVTDKLATMLELDSSVYRFTTNAVEQAPTGGGGGGTIIPVSQVHVPPARTWGLKQSGNDLVGEFKIGAKVGTSKVYQIDFAKDLATNGQIDGITSIAITDFSNGGTEDGLTFPDEDGDQDQGVDQSNGKFRIVPTVAGTYEITMWVHYDNNDGGGDSSATVIFVASPATSE